MAQQKKRKRQRKVGSLASVGVNTKIRRDRNGKFVNKSGINKSKGSNAKYLIAANKKRARKRKVNSAIAGTIAVAAVAGGAYAYSRGERGVRADVRIAKSHQAVRVTRLTTRGNTNLASAAHTRLGGQSIVGGTIGSKVGVKSFGGKTSRATGSQRAASKSYSSSERSVLSTAKPRKAPTAPSGSTQSSRVSSKADQVIARARRKAYNPAHNDRLHKAKMTGHSIKFGAMRAANDRTARASVERQRRDETASRHIMAKIKGNRDTTGLVRGAKKRYGFK